MRVKFAVVAGKVCCGCGSKVIGPFQSFCHAQEGESNARCIGLVLWSCGIGRPLVTRMGTCGMHDFSLTPSMFVVLCFCRSQKMYEGVLRDDKRRADRILKRESELEQSARKREAYEKVQSVSSRREGGII